MYDLYVWYMQLFHALGCFLLGFVSIYFFNSLKHIFIPTSPRVDSVTNRSKMLMMKLSDICANHQKKEYEESMRLLKEKVPQYIINRIPPHLLVDLQKAVDKPPKKYLFATNYAMQFLKKYSVDDEVVIDWLSKLYEIDISS